MTEVGNDTPHSGAEVEGALLKGTLLGAPNREPQEYSRNIMEYKDPGSIVLLYTYYILRGPGLGFPVESLYY